MKFNLGSETDVGLGDNFVRLVISMSVGGFIGWITNYIAIKSLFHPRTPRKLLFFELQGLLPKRQNELAENLGRVVEDELLNFEELSSKVKPEDLDPVLNKYLKKLRGELEQNQWVQALPDYLASSVLDRLQVMLFKTLKPRIPEIVEGAAREVTKKISVHEIVAEKIKTMDLGRIEEITYRISDREMKMIVRLGGVLGILVGFAQWLIQFLAYG